MKNMFDRIKRLLGLDAVNPKITECKFRHCHIYFNDHEMLIVCVFTTPGSLSPVGLPMEKFSREAASETIGEYVLKCLSESRLIGHEIDRLKVLDSRVNSLPGFSDFYKLAGVQSDRALAQKFRLIMVSQAIENNEVTLHTTRPDKGGGYYSTVDDPVISASPIASDVGEKIRSAMEYQPPMPKSRKKQTPPQ